MLEALDRELSRFIGSLDAVARDNLLIILIGDNGTPRQVSQAPIERRKAKGTIFEGGVRTPLVVWGAKVSRKGKREASLVNSTDLFATIASIAGVPKNKIEKTGIDSISFAPLLSAAKPHPRKFAYVEHFGKPESKMMIRRGIRLDNTYGWAIRDARWKLMSNARNEALLFDLSKDPFEKRNLASPNMSSDLMAVYRRLADKRIQLAGVASSIARPRLVHSTQKERPGNRTRARGACRRDVFRFCRDARAQGRRAVRQCLMRNAGRISATCKRAIGG